MNKAVAHILKNKLADVPFVEKLAGLVYTAEYQDVSYGENGETPTTIEKKIPISCDVDVANCDKHDLVPDSSKKGILYFEDRGSSPLGKQGPYQRFRSDLRLVCWLNTEWIKNDSCTEASVILITHIIGKLQQLQLQNSTPFVKFELNFTNIPKQDRTIFAPYTYDLYNTQYVLPPYEFFAIDISVSYMIPNSCIADLSMRDQEEFNSFKNCTV